MTLTDLIAHLAAIRAEHGGDLPVIVDDEDFETAVTPDMVRFGFTEDGDEALLIDTVE